MKKTLLLVPALAVLAGCSSGPRDATNDPDVQYMLKNVNQQGKMGGGDAPTPPPQASATPQTTNNPANGSAPTPSVPLANP